MTGVVVDGSGFEIVAGGERVGPRRELTETDEVQLSDLGVRYLRAVQSQAGDDVFLALGRELWKWLNGAEGQLSALLERISAPVTFEVRGPRSPVDREWTLLRAPFELLARPGGGFLAADAVERFCVVRRLGRSAAVPEPDGFRLGLAFMASSPRRQHELDFEAEEAAILAAVDDTRVDLVVEDTGNPVELGRRLADLGGMPVVHLSCHGVNKFVTKAGRLGEPVLMMEDEVGDELPTTAADLVRLFASSVPRLLFVSACLTDAAAGAPGHLAGGAGRRSGTTDGGPDPMLAHSMATALVAAGFPAVLGWDGSVGDQAATAFAEVLYQQLSNRADLALAVGDARRALLNSDDRAMRADWHLARLWIGPAGGGPVVTGTERRSRVSAVHGTKVFLDRKQHVPVAAPSMFVGRRPELQRTLRVLRGQDKAGVLLHGQGRLGKSSLAARIADRCPQLVPAVVFGDYSAAAILDVVDDAVRADKDARDLIEQRRAQVRDRPEALEQLLLDLLSGPCAQAGRGHRPLLLVIDDLEQVLELDPNGPHRVDPRVAGVLAGVLRAFDPGLTDSRLLVTSRFQFTLGGLEGRLEQVPLRPLSAVAQRKLLHRQQVDVSAERRQERDGLAERAMTVSRGNPGLQDLIGLRLVYSEQVDAGRAEAAVAGMEAYLQQGRLPSEAELRVFLENLALDTLIEQAGAEHRTLLRDLTLFELPVPEPVAAVLAERAGGSTKRLVGLGLLDVFPDGYDSRRPALAVNALAAGRVDPLDDTEITELAQVVAEPLYAAWGGAAESNRDLGSELQLTLIALRADTPGIVAHCATGAVEALRSGPAVGAFRLGQEAIGLLDRHRVPVPSFLLRRVADAARISGDGDTAEHLYSRASRQTQADGPDQTDPRERARVTAEHATFLLNRGEVQQAEQLLQQAHQLFSSAGSEREAAICQGRIADIIYQRGDYDEALRIRREVELPVYERLGDALSTAVTWGQVADILYQRGDYDEALRIRREMQLPVFERLSETRATAVAWGKIADILYQRGDYDETLRIRREVELPVFEQLGDTREVAITWGSIADILYQRGDYDETLRIRREVELPVYERLGDTRSTAVTWGQIADILYQRGDYDEALRIRREVELPVYERLGDTRSTAITWGGIANILYQRGDYDEALRIRREMQLPVYERLGDTRKVAITWGNIADILHQRGDYDETLRIRREMQLPVYERLGDTRSTAITWGSIADILYQRGDYDEALRIRREMQLPVYERLGDTRSTAITWGNIADILYERGDFDEAAALHTKRLRVCEQLGDLEGVAAAKWGLAQIDLARENYEDALPRIMESFLSLCHLQKHDGIAVVGSVLGQLLLATGDHEQARSVLEDSLAAAEKIGATSMFKTLGDLIHQSRNPER
ncbi:tetratricopeptide repeat protein [Actinoplanes lobatus]|uniref:Tetratricopeptide (TPR) repeat protein n=3 Tax=Actinoplanes lobatus TaxID=113568 RepID=A0A7W7HKH9_9ACTN|nr:tetratricopeptide repeat protein [Actinoplanes lobatus]MBB4752204.1 tetratricopeptide (TPR) repeat protein [Actinoplanes lobatus]